MTDSLEPNNKDKNKKEKEESTSIFYKSYFIFTQFVIEVILFIGSAIVLGLYLDYKANTKCLFLILFIFLFGFVPIRNLYVRLNNRK